MKLYYHPDSPFVRKVTITAHECGLLADIELLDAAAHPVQRDMSIVSDNPLGQVPTFLAENGLMLADSRVICEYLDSKSDAGLFPSHGDARWYALRNQALADGLILSAVQARYERLIRPEDRQWSDWYEAHMAKINSVLDYFENNMAFDAESFDIGGITVACALGYLDYRYKQMDWRERRRRTAAWFEQVSDRQSMKAIRYGVDIRLG